MAMALDKGGGPTMDDISPEESDVDSPAYETLAKTEENMDTSPAVDATSDQSSATSLATSTVKSTSATDPTSDHHSTPPFPPQTQIITLDLPSAQGSNQSSSSQSAIASSAPRPKAYPPGSNGPFLVFFRPKGKPLNKPQIERDLAKTFRGVLSVDSPSRNKLRVTVSDREVANRIAAYELFSMEYKVYLPSKEIEISGVVTEEFLSCADIKAGTGGFKNRAVPSVAVLDASQLNYVASDGTKQPSNSFRVTFSGSALPDFLILGKLRLPVRLYKPTVMYCDKCQQMGHTKTFCCNKPRCGKCGEQHAEGACTTEPKCSICGQAPHELTACPKFIEREKHQMRSLQQRSRRTYAEMLKKIAPPVDPAAPSAQFNTSNNLFTSLPVYDETSDSEDGEGFSVIQTGTKRMRAAAKRQRQQSSQNVTVVQQKPRAPLEKSRSDVKTPKAPPPGFNFTPREWTSLPGTSKTPGVPVLRSESQQNKQQVPPQEPRQQQVETSDKMTLSELVDIIFETMEVSPATRKLIKMVISLVKPLLKRMASNWPTLDSLISFDG